MCTARLPPTGGPCAGGGDDFTGDGRAKPRYLVYPIPRADGPDFAHPIRICPARPGHESHSGLSVKAQIERTVELLSLGEGMEGRRLVRSIHGLVPSSGNLPTSLDLFLKNMERAATDDKRYVCGTKDAGRLLVRTVAICD